MKKELFWVLCVGISKAVLANQLIFRNEEGAEKNVGRGDFAAVECALKDGLQGEVKWFRDGAEVGRKEFTTPPDLVYEQRRPDGKASELQIKVVADEDAGDYTCKGFIGSSSVEAVFTIKVFVPVTFEDCPVHQHPVRGQREQLVSCYVFGNPPPQVTWTFNNIQINPETSKNKYRIDSEQKGLFILNVTEEDDGPLEVTARAATGIKYRQITIETHTKPKITQLDEKYAGVRGKSLSIVCYTYGHPHPKVRWYKIEGRARSQILSDGRFVVEEEENRLYISELLESDSGMLECEADNGNSLNILDKKQTRLEVQVPPTQETPIVNVTKPVDDAAEIRCRVKGVPHPEIRWQQIGRSGFFVPGVQPADSNIEVSQSYDEQTLEVVSTLSFKAARKLDNGTYLCYAENEAGTFKVNGSVIIMFPPEFKDTPEVRYLWTNAKKNISCHVDASPRPTWTWFRNEMEITTNDQNRRWYHIYNLPGGNLTGNLQINVEPGKENVLLDQSYRCLAVHSMGNAKKTINVRRAYIPDPPTVSLKSKGPTQLTLDVVPNALYEGPNMTRYVVKYKPTGVASDDFVPIDMPVRGPFQVERLFADTSYDLRISAVNEVGLGNYAQMSATTDKPTPPDTPVLLAGAPYVTSINVQWEAEENGSPVREFAARFRQVRLTGGDQVDEAMSGKWSDWEVSPRTHYKLDNLEPETSYQVEVKVKNAEGYSPVGSRVYSTQKDDGTAAGVSSAPRLVAASGFSALWTAAIVVAAAFSNALKL